MTSNAWDAATYESTFGFVARYGDDLLNLLDPMPGERILDLGCGTGRHAAEITARGARVIGMDADQDMLDKARRDHPEVTFVSADATSFDLHALGAESAFDACFSNAALHWMTPQDVVLQNVRSVLATGARFVAEMGGAQNIAALDSALRDGLRELSLDAPVVRNYFPTVGEQSTALESAGFRVELAMWFRRPTPLSEGTTAADWTKHFRATTWSAVPERMRAELSTLIDERAAREGLHTVDGWIADYCRLRFVAVAT